jgi:cobyrinic acid a,c-diamide synthase
MRALCISATGSNQGKTILTTALLYYFKDSVRPFKIGPDYIDPQFHQQVCFTPSINLDTYMMNKKQVRWMFNQYSDKKISICEGVMGFYDGLNKGCSAYDVSKLLKIPTILLLDGSGSYITVSAVLKGLKTYKKKNTIKAVVLNKISSYNHYMLIKNQIEKDFDDISVVGWIKKDLECLNDTHLGLDLDDKRKIEFISIEVLKHIDIKKIKQISKIKKQKNKNYPFKKIKKQNKKLAIVSDENFSFLYWDNYIFLKQLFHEVVIIDSTKDEPIPSNCHSVYICGGYVETNEAYNKIKNSENFKNSLILHSKTKKIYAECAGLLYLGNSVDDKKMSGIIDIDFILNDRFVRLGYYINQQNIKGHSFHYTAPVNYSNGFDILSKSKGAKGSVGSWCSKNKNAMGTYLHIMFRNNTKLIKKYLIGE